MKERNHAQELERNLAAFVRAFGLHQNEQTPCGVNVTVSEAHTLVELARSEQLNQSELINFLKLEKSSVSRLVEGLVKKGWLKKIKHPQDSRAFLLEITDEGRKKAAVISKARKQKFETLLEKLDKAQQETIVTAFATLTEVLNESSS